MSRSLRTVLGSTAIAAAVMLVISFSADNASLAASQAPTAEVPPALVGSWDTFFGSLGPVTVELTPSSATVHSERKQRLGFLAGKFAVDGEFKLKVLWDLPAFQQSLTNPVPAAAFNNAIVAKGDATYPQYLPTTVTLRYDSTKDELSGTYQGLTIHYDTTPARHFDSLHVSSIPIRLSRGASPDCAPLPDSKPIFTIKPHGPTRVNARASIDSPLTDSFPAVDVRTVVPMPEGSAGKTAVEGAQVEWEIRRGDRTLTTYVTETDTNGVGRLQFVLQPDGGLAPADQIRSRPETLAAGEYTVIARVPSLETGSVTYSPGLAPPPVQTADTFKLSLKREGALLNFLDESGANAISALSWPPPEPGRVPWARPLFRLEVADFNEDDKDEEKTITVRSFRADGVTPQHTIEVTAKKVAAGIFRYAGKPIEIYAAPAGVNVPGVRSNYLYVTKAPVTKITATYTSARHEVTTSTITLYDDPSTVRREQLRQAILHFQESLNGIRASSHSLTPERREQLDYKQRLLDRALQALDNAKLGLKSSGPVFVAASFFEVARKGPPYHPAPTKTFYWQRKGAGSESLNAVDPSLVMDKFTIETNEERAALARRQRDYWDQVVDQGYEATAQQLDNALGLNIELPKDSAARQQRIREILANGALSVGKGVASMALSKPLGLVYAGWVLATGTTLDGENADGIDMLTAGLDLVSFDLHTGPGERLRERIALKARKLREWRSVASKIAQVANNPTLEEMAYARELIRTRNGILSKAWAIARDPSLSLTEQVRQISKLLTRVPNPHVAQMLADEYASIPGVMNARLGTAFHRQKELETRAFMEWMTAAGRVARGSRPGMYVWEVVENGRTVKYYEMIEMEMEVGSKVKRIDGALARVSPVAGESFVRIRDLTTTLSPTHLAKGKTYQTAITSVVAELQNLPASYCEYYWTESSAAGAVGSLRLKNQLDRLR